MKLWLLNLLIIFLVKGDLEIQLLSGVADMNPKIEIIDGEHFVTGNRVDYEAIPERNGQLLLRITDNGDTSNQDLKINVINLDDEPPTFTPGPCSMEVSSYNLFVDY